MTQGVKNLHKSVFYQKELMTALKPGLLGRPVKLLTHPPKPWVIWAHTSWASWASLGKALISLHFSSPHRV